MQSIQVQIIVLLFALWPIRAGFAASSPSLNDRGWLAFGDMRGYFEPCGCDPDADLGGVKRIGGFFERERALRPKLSIYSLGNNLPFESKSQGFKSDFLLRGIETFNVDAYLINDLEWQARSTIKWSSYRIPYVISNAVKANPVFKDHVLKDHTIVMGYLGATSNIKPSELNPINGALLDVWRKKLNKLRSSKMVNDAVLLFSGSQADLDLIINAKLFDVVISSNSAPMSKVIGPEEKNDERLLARLSKDVVVSQVPLGGQGVLRGGILTTSAAPLLKDLLGATQESPTEVGLLSQTKTVTWLDKSYQGITNRYDRIAADYAHAAAGIFDNNVKERIAALKNSPYLGAERCSTCHAKAVEVWKSSSHAKAWSTLVAVKQDKNPECVSCHVVGYSANGGFASFEASPHLANVQCENCHGPRRDHAANPKPAAHPSAAKQVCVTCHQGAHSPHFDFQSYWQKIQH